MFRAKTVKSRIPNRIGQLQQTRTRSRHPVLANAVKSAIELLESRQLLSATGIGVHFTGGGNGTADSLASTDTAGVFPIANYNNEATGAQTGITLNDDTGTATTATLTYTSGGTWNSRNYTPPAGDGDQELNDGFIFGSSKETITGIPYANYDIYIYELNDGAGRVETTTNVNTSVAVYGSSATPGDANHESGTVNNYQYIAANGTTSAAPTLNADFVAFSGSTPSFVFATSAPGNGYLNGFEIVDHTTTAPTLTAATAGNNIVALAWTYGNAQAQSNTFTYTIYRNGTQLATGVTGQTYTDTTAVNNTAYTYYVEADNGIGPSANSNSLTATPLPAAPPAPTGIAASRTNATTVAVSFNASLGAASYDVERGTALNANGTLGGTITDLTPGGTTQTSVTDTSAPASAYYAVTATNTGGTSAPSIAAFVGNGDGWQASYYTSDTANTAVYDGDQTANVNLTQPDGTAIPGAVTQPGANPPSNNAILGFQRNEDGPIDDVAAGNAEFAATTAPPNAPSNFNSIEGANVSQDLAIRWVGYIEAPYTGYYTLNPTSDDGVAITVYDTTHLTAGGLPTPVTLQPDNLFLGRGPATDSDPVVDSTGAAVQWIAGQKYLVQMDYNNGGGNWEATLSDEVSSTTANQTSGTYDIQPLTLIPVSQVVAPVPTFQTVDAANPGGLAKDSSYYTLSALPNSTIARLTFPNIGADSYNIYRSTSPTGPFTTPLANVPETTGGPIVYTDMGLTNGTKYYYVVTGVDQAGETPIASGLTASVTPEPTAPAAPANLQATRTGAYTVALTWSPAVFATSYDVERGTVLNANGTLGGTITDITPGGTTSTSATDSNAFQQTTFYYQVTASDAGGTSTASNTATVTAIFSFGGAPPAISVNFTGGGNGTSGPISLAPATKAGVVPEADYNNENGGAQSGVALNDSTGSATAATLNYTAGGTYNSVGGTVTPVTGDQQLNDGFVYGNTNVIVNNIPYANYNVYVYELNDGAGRVETTTDNIGGVSFYGSSATPTDANHESGTANTYQYLQSTSTAVATPTANGDYVLFANENGSTVNFTDSATGNGYLNGFEIVDEPTAAPATAAVLSLGPVGNDTVTLNYTEVLDASTYTVYRTDPAHPTPIVVATNITSLSYTDTTVTNGVTYTYTVAGDNSFGEGPLSNAVTATPEPAAPPAPANPQATRTGANTVALTWSPAVFASTYDVERGTALNANGTIGGTITDVTPGGTTQTSATDSAAPGAAYYYAVTATNGAGTSSPSIAVFVGNGDGWQASYYTSDAANSAVFDGDQTANVTLTQPDGTAIPGSITQPPANPLGNNAILGFQRNETTPIDDVGEAATSAPPNAPASFNSIESPNVGQDMAIRWVGYFEPQYTAYYTFNPSTTDGVAITVFDTTHLTNGKPTPVTLQPDNLFVTRGATTDSDPVVDSTGAAVQWIAGQEYEVQMDYNTSGGTWQAVLSDEASSTAANQASGTYDIQTSKLVPISQVLAPAPTFQTVDAANPGGLAKDSSYYTISAQPANTAAHLTFSSIGADTYNIYRSTSAMGPFTTPIASVPGTNGGTVTFNDTGLTNGTKYYYVVTGVDQSGQTPIAAGLTTSVTPEPIAPAAPANLQATRTGGFTVALTWGPSLFATSYDVERGTVLNANGTLGGTITDITPGGTTNTSATDSNAFQQTTFYYQVTASNGGGTSTASNTATVTANFSTIPSAFGVNFVGGGNGGGASVTSSAGVVPLTTWYNEANSSGSGTLTATDGVNTASLTYTDNGTWNNGTTTATGNGQLLNGYLDTNGVSPVVTFSGLTGSAYDVYVYTEGDNVGTASNYVINGVDNKVDETPPGGNSDALTPDPTDSVLVGGTGGTYVVNLSVAPVNGVITITSNTDGEFRSPINGVEVVLSAFNQDTNGAPTAAPTAAPVLSPATVGNGSVALSYTAVPNASSYTVYRTDPAHPTPVPIATNVPTTSYTDNTVASGVTYTYTVAADNTLGEGPPSNAVMATAVVSTPPTILSVTPEDSAGNGVAAGSLTSGVNTQGQRSLETQIAVVFSEPVNLAAGAFNLALINNYGSGTNDGSPNTDVSAVLGTPTNPSGDGVTWIIPIIQNGTSTTYSYNLANGTTASLQDGIYQLGVNAANVTAVTGGAAISSNYTSSMFHRLFGDLQNTDNLNNFDLSVLGGFRNVANLNTDLDFNGNGQADNTDLGAFRRNFNKTFTAPLGT